MQGKTKDCTITNMQKKGKRNLLLAINSGTFGNSNLVENVFFMEFEAINSGHSGMFDWPIL